MNELKSDKKESYDLRTAHYHITENHTLINTLSAVCKSHAYVCWCGAFPHHFVSKLEKE